MNWNDPDLSRIIAQFGIAMAELDDYLRARGCQKLSLTVSGWKVTAPDDYPGPPAPICGEFDAKELAKGCSCEEGGT